MLNATHVFVTESVIWVIIQFQKADADLDYLSRKLDAEFNNDIEAQGGDPMVRINLIPHCLIF